MDVWRWAAAWRDDGFEQRILAIRFLAGRQEPVHIADHGNGAAIAGFSHKRMPGHDRLTRTLIASLPPYHREPRLRPAFGEADVLEIGNDLKLDWLDRFNRPTLGERV